jgi:ABC-type dipeptide/oligopeptide/nickel transport system ATPase component
MRQRVMIALMLACTPRLSAITEFPTCRGLTIT